MEPKFQVVSLGKLGFFEEELQLNQTETVFPGTDLRMIFEIGKMKIPEKSSAGSDIGSIAKS